MSEKSDLCRILKLSTVICESMGKRHFYDKKPENALLYIKPEYPTKKEYIADNKHVIQKYASKRSEGMRD